MGPKYSRDKNMTCRLRALSWFAKDPIRMESGRYEEDSHSSSAESRRGRSFHSHVPRLSHGSGAFGLVILGPMNRRFFFVVETWRIMNNHKKISHVSSHVLLVLLAARSADPLVIPAAPGSRWQGRICMRGAGNNGKALAGGHVGKASASSWRA